MTLNKEIENVKFNLCPLEIESDLAFATSIEPDQHAHPCIRIKVYNL